MEWFISHAETKVFDNVPSLRHNGLLPLDFLLAVQAEYTPKNNLCTARAGSACVSLLTEMLLKVGKNDTGHRSDFHGALISLYINP